MAGGRIVSAHDCNDGAGMSMCRSAQFVPNWAAFGGLAVVLLVIACLVILAIRVRNDRRRR